MSLPLTSDPTPGALIANATSSNRFARTGPRAGACRRPAPFVAVIATALAVVVSGCDPDVAERVPPEPVAGSPVEPVGEVPAEPAPQTPAGPSVEPLPGETDGGPGDFRLVLPDAPLPLVEGGEPLELAVSLVRDEEHARVVTLAAVEDGVEANGLVWRFADERLEPGETETTLSVSLPIGPLPREPETRRLRLLASDGTLATVGAEIVFATTPTDAPDIYLLAGQSNMVGSTLPDARMIGPGEPDAPDPRILQLDVTINDLQRFPDPSAYTDVARIAPPDRRIVEALDPLHDIRDRGKDTKSGTTIGLGLPFAREALPNTTADIVLVPAAWSDTGFCLRETSRFGGATGWNAVRPEGAAFAGTLLHDRAIARTNLAIEETGGILRGILWHQGEADSDDIDCALAYDENLRAMVASLRTNIAVDARGPDARGPDADIPFVLGTMSKGADARGGALAPGGTFPEPKAIVDAVHRDVENLVPFSGVVNADDLVPSNGFPCGQGFCIHFGAAALRELGARYYRELAGIFTGN